MPRYTMSGSRQLTTCYDFDQDYVVLMGARRFTMLTNAFSEKAGHDAASDRHALRVASR